LAVSLTVFGRWSHPRSAYSLDQTAPSIELLNHLSILLVLVLFGCAGVWIARQQARFVHAQHSLTDLEAKLTSVVQLTPDALILANADGRIVFWNPSAEKMFGYPPEDALGRPLTLIMPERFREAHLRGFRRVCETGVSRLIGRTLQLSGLTKAGREFPLELSLATWETKGTRFFSAFLRDLTERKQLETRQAVQLAISRVLMDAETVEQAGSNILQAIGHLIDWEVGLIWLLEQRTQTLCCATVWERADGPGLKEFIRHSLATTFPPGVGLPGRILMSGEPDWITNVARDDNFPRLSSARAADLHAAFGFPIKGSQGVLGVIEFFAREVRPPDTGLLHAFADIGIKVGQFVERAQLAEHTAALVRDLQAAAAGVKTIAGLVPICATCKRIRNPDGGWQEIERFVEDHSTAQFSHTVCGTCARHVHPDWDTA
jgi:PAS domain S-box-containing protein